MIGARDLVHGRDTSMWAGGSGRQLVDGSDVGRGGGGKAWVASTAACALS